MQDPCEADKIHQFLFGFDRGGAEGAGRMTYSQLIGGVLAHVRKAGRSHFKLARKKKKTGKSELKGGAVQHHVGPVPL